MTTEENNNVHDCTDNRGAAHVKAIHSSKKAESKKRSSRSVFPAGTKPEGLVPCCLASPPRLFMPRIGILGNRERFRSDDDALQLRHVGSRLPHTAFQVSGTSAAALALVTESWQVTAGRNF